MNKLANVFTSSPEGVLNIFFTAGYPALDSAPVVAKALNEAGVGLIEIGMPYSDPLADGTTIQDSSQKALENGMNLDVMFNQVKDIADHTDLAIVLMGYLNQLMTVGIETFLIRCKESGVDGLIIPDLPMDIYENDYKDLFDKYEMSISFLITPRTSPERIMEADRLSTGFVYLVSDNSITGASTEGFSSDQLAYFQRIKDMKLSSNVLIGFGIKSKEQFILTKKYANGAIIGSEFIRQLRSESHSLAKDIKQFIRGILN